VTDERRSSELGIFVSRLRRTPWRKAVRQAWRRRGRADELLLPERLEGAVYGHLCGDALGVPYEFTPPDAIGTVAWRGHGTYDQPPGTWSDDGALTLALLDSLLSAGFDLEDQGRRALAWIDDGEYAVGGVVFDIGGATSAALGAIRAGRPAASAGSTEALGNGSLMRILPVALVARDATDAVLVQRATAASRVTHGSAEAQIACALYVLVAVRLLRGATDRAAVLGEARAALRDALATAGLTGSAEAAAPADAVAALDAFEAWSGRAGRGRVVDSFWSAWDAFAGAADYPAAVTAAVRYGNDTDTTAAIAGGLAGAYWGIEEVPPAWHRGLRDRAMAQALIDRLVATDDSEWSGTPWRTSLQHPLRVDWMDLAGTDLGARGGRIGMTFMPGKRYMGYYSGPHWRDLDSDARQLREQDVDVLLLLVEDHELRRCRADAVAEVLPHHDVELLRHPLVDLQVPADGVAYRQRLASLLDRVRAGERLAVACRGGLDRSGMTAGCLLREAGLDADTAIGRVHDARRHTLSLPIQISYVRDWPGPAGR
jgi:ADP-ribosylglycohydrolase